MEFLFDFSHLPLTLRDSKQACHSTQPPSDLACSLLNSEYFLEITQDLLYGGRARLVKYIEVRRKFTEDFVEALLIFGAHNSISYLWEFGLRVRQLVNRLIYDQSELRRLLAIELATFESAVTALLRFLRRPERAEILARSIPALILLARKLKFSLDSYDRFRELLISSNSHLYGLLYGTTLDFAVEMQHRQLQRNYLSHMIRSARCEEHREYLVKETRDFLELLQSNLGMDAKLWTRQFYSMFLETLDELEVLALLSPEAVPEHTFSPTSAFGDFSSAGCAWNPLDGIPPRALRGCDS